MIPEPAAQPLHLYAPKPGADATPRISSLPPLSVYVHVPWCVRKCPYCDFNSHALRGDLPEAQYLDALAADLEQALPSIWGRQVVSVFIGGGTPSLLSAAAMDRMLALLRAYLPLLPDAEITLEANPGASEAQRFMDYAASGINRISLGVQSFDDAALKALGRIHDAAAARRAIAAAQRAVSRVNLDLMFALPKQTLAQCEQDLRQAMTFGTEHLSLYHLTLEPNTIFAKYPPTVPDDDASAAMQDHVAQLAQDAGWVRYEVSAYARAGACCRHNLNYWEFGDYLGLGPGAHGKLTFHDRIERHVKRRHPATWMQQAVQRDGSHVAQTHNVTAQALPFEFMLNVLRLKNGVPAHYFAERTGLPITHAAAGMRHALARELLDPDPTRLRTTPLGWRFLNDVLEGFL